MPFSIHQMLSIGSLSAFSDPFSEVAANDRLYRVKETRDAGGSDPTTTSGRLTAPFSPSQELRDQGRPNQGHVGQDSSQPGAAPPRGSILDLSI